MEDETTKAMQERINSLPQEIKSMIYSSEMVAAIRQISTKHQLHVDQTGALESEVVAAMIGVTPLTELAENISDALDIDETKSNAIVVDVNELLLSKIRNSMKQADARTTTAPATQPSNPPAISQPPMAEADKSTEKSVVMPSAAKAPVPAVTTPMPAQPIAPAVTITAPTATPALPEIIKPAGLPMTEHIDTMLSQPTVSITPLNPAPGAGSGDHSVVQNGLAKPAITPSPDIKKSDAPAPPPIYKTDPYHEPID